MCDVKRVSLKRPHPTDESAPIRPSPIDFVQEKPPTISRATTSTAALWGGYN